MRAAPLVLLTLLAAQAWAGRPFATEDAGVLERGACEWESVAARVTWPAMPSGRSLSTQLGCGTGAGLQFAANIGRASAGDERLSSLGLGGKWALWSAGEAGLTLAWSSGWSRPRGAGRSWDGGAALLAFSQELGGGWTAHANLLRSYSRPDRDWQTGWAALVERQLAESFDVGAELAGEGSQRPGWGLGARWRPADGWTLDASLARSGGRPRERLLSLGLKLEF